jgi:RHS repeat-associated protein
MTERTALQRKGRRGTAMTGTGITNEYEVMEGRYEYDVFGVPYEEGINRGMNLGYTGKPYDTVTGLYNYGYRDYQPETARFTMVDPVRDGANWFAYVNNDPVNWVDLWGLSASEPKQGFLDKVQEVAEKALSVVGFLTGSFSDIAKELGYGSKVKGISYVSNAVDIVSTTFAIDKAIGDPNPDTISDAAITAVSFVPIVGNLANVEATLIKDTLVQAATATAELNQTQKTNPVGFNQNIFDYFVTYKRYTHVY